MTVGSLRRLLGPFAFVVLLLAVGRAPTTAPVLHHAPRGAVSYSYDLAHNNATARLSLAASATKTEPGDRARSTKVAGTSPSLTSSVVAAEGEMGAYETAAAGGRHAGFLENYAGKSTAEIERGINSIEKQIAQHESWIEDPYSKISDWDKLDPRQQDALINRKWPGDIQRQREQLEILRRILEGRE